MKSLLGLDRSRISTVQRSFSAAMVLVQRYPTFEGRRVMEFSGTNTSDIDQTRLTSMKDILRDEKRDCAWSSRIPVYHGDAPTTGTL